MSPQYTGRKKPYWTLIAWAIIPSQQAREGHCKHVSYPISNCLARPFDIGLNRWPRDPTVVKWLLRHGICRVVVGHKPTGDCPAVLSASYTGVEIVSADTSFSDTSFNNNRGSAIAVVEIVGTRPDQNCLDLSGRFSNGQDYHCQYPVLDGSKTDNVALVDDCTAAPPSGNNNKPSSSYNMLLLGRQVDDGWWVKAATSTHYQLCRGQGRKVEYKMVFMQEQLVLK
jgi:hypothetical protein